MKFTTHTYTYTHESCKRYHCKEIDDERTSNPGQDSLRFPSC